MISLIMGALAFTFLIFFIPIVFMIFISTFFKEL